MILPGIFIATLCFCGLTAAAIITRALLAVVSATRRGLAPQPS
jgi:hypothetical protein